MLGKKLQPLILSLARFSFCFPICALGFYALEHAYTISI